MTTTNRDGDSTQRDLIAGIILYNVVVQIVLFVIHKELLWLSIGLWIGACAACLMTMHMKRSIEDALDLGESGALSHIRKTYILRIIVFIAIVIATFYFQIGSVLTLFIGTMGLKVSAYLQPYINKFFTKIKF
jgi:hypothetical protein